MNGRPGRKAIGRRPNMDENILKKIQIPPFTKEDPFELIKKTRERILGDCIQVIQIESINQASISELLQNLHRRQQSMGGSVRDQLALSKLGLKTFICFFLFMNYMRSISSVKAGE